MSYITEDVLNKYTDVYFRKTRSIVKDNGDNVVIYAFFLRTKSIFAPKFFRELLNKIAKDRDFSFEIITKFNTGDIVEAKQAMLFLKVSFVNAVDLETLLLQTLGIPCVIAYRAYKMVNIMPNISMLEMGARHSTTPQMSVMVSYAVALGSKIAIKEDKNIKGFMGTSIGATAKYFPIKHSIGTMPHSLIGYAGSTLKAAQMFYKKFPQDKLVVLVDYFAQELTDSIEIGKYFIGKLKLSDIAIRVDTSQSRYIEGLNQIKSKNIIQNSISNTNSLEPLTTEEQEYLFGKGTSVASAYFLRKKLDEFGFNKIKLVYSSNFNIKKIKIFAKFKAPVDIIGTGSFLSYNFATSYTTADIICYRNKFMVKKGREKLIEQYIKLTKKK